MGQYTTAPIEKKDVENIINTIAHGYVDDEGIRHKPNRQIGTILLLQANLGCRIGDICNLAMENIVQEGQSWKLDLTEQKTGKKRYFIIPGAVKKVIDRWIYDNDIREGRLFSIGEQAVWKQIRPVTKALGLENVSSHSFRKYAAMKIYEASGKDIALTSAYLNHADTKTTMLYLRRSTKQMDEVISRAVTLV